MEIGLPANIPTTQEGRGSNPVRPQKKQRQQSADAITWKKNAPETVEKSTNDDMMANDNGHHLRLATESHVFDSKQRHTTKTHKFSDYLMIYIRVKGFSRQSNSRTPTKGAVHNETILTRTRVQRFTLENKGGAPTRAAHNQTTSMTSTRVKWFS
jgi:hypothetical protein